MLRCVLGKTEAWLSETERHPQRMARKLRIGFAGACYHVINRGNYRRDLFAEPGAATSFERCLGEAASRFGWRVHAYVVMRNHFHIALETPEPTRSRRA